MDLDILDHSSQATAMFLAFLQDFIAYECIEGDRLISTSVTCKLECLTLPPCFPEHHLRNNNNNNNNNNYKSKL